MITPANRDAQLRLALAKSPSYGRSDFVLSPVNHEAVGAIDAWPAWPNGKLALIGPEGSGKTHLAQIWARESGAVQLYGHETDLASFAGRPVLLEDADRRPADETLFHLMNMSDAGGGLLITGRTPPLEWPTALPDLRSRLNAMMVVTLAPPDDIVLEGVLLKFFKEKNIRPGTDVMSYLLRRIERSIPAARDVVERIDERAGAGRREITRPLAREILEENETGGGLFG